jgi:cation diffusion facilitator family transporter
VTSIVTRVREYDIASKAAILSVASNGVLLVVKLAFALAFGSVALLADGVDSAEDLVASAIVFFTVRMALQPADEEHPYGHGKAESLAALSQAALIAGGAVFITVTAVLRLAEGEYSIEVGPSLIAVGITAVVNLLVALYAFRAARISGSVAVRSDARHLMTNVVQALAVGGALVLVGLTGNEIFDPLFALLLAAYLLWTAFTILRSALHELLDTSLPEETLARIDECMNHERVGLRGYHALRTRKSGRETYIDMHMLIDPAMSVSAAHVLSDEVEDDLRGHIPGAVVTIHVDPDEPGIMERTHPETTAPAPGLHLHRH